MDKYIKYIGMSIKALEKDINNKDYKEGLNDISATLAWLSTVVQGIAINMSEGDASLESNMAKLEPYVKALGTLGDSIAKLNK